MQLQYNPTLFSLKHYRQQEASLDSQMPLPVIGVAAAADGDAAAADDDDGAASSMALMCARRCRMWPFMSAYLTTGVRCEV